MHLISPNEAEALLGVLCTRFGFCLTALWHARLRDCPPHSVTAFIDAVFHAEGLDPQLADRAMYEAMAEEARLAFNRSSSADVLLRDSSLDGARKG